MIFDAIEIFVRLFISSQFLVLIPLAPKSKTMKLAIASLLVGTAAAFAPGATFNARNTALNMATETSEKVCGFVYAQIRGTCQANT